MTSPIEAYVPQMDRAVVQARYAELCALRDKINAEVAPIREQLRKEADEAEAARVKSMGTAKRLYEARGGKKWFLLKKEIGILAKTLGGILPPTPDQQAKGAEIAKAIATKQAAQKAAITGKVK